MTEEHKQNIQKWELLIKDRLASGMSVAKFCKANGYTENMYYHWINEVHKADPDFDTNSVPVKAQTKTKKEEKGSSLVEITPAAPKKAVSHAVSDSADARFPVAEICFGTVRIELYQTADASFIRSLLEAVLYVQA